MRQTRSSSLGRVHVKLPDTLNDGASAIPKRRTKVDPLKEFNSKTEQVFQSNITEVVGGAESPAEGISCPYKKGEQQCDVFA